MRQALRGYSLRRLRDLLRRRGPAVLVALALWLAWTLLAIALDRALDEPLPPLLLLGAVIFIAGGLGYLWLRRELRRQQWQESARQQEYTFLSMMVRPRRPLPALRGWMAEPLLLLGVWELILKRRPVRVLELGSGLSTLVMAYALEKTGQGHLVALENAMDYAAVSRQMLADHGLAGRARILDAPLRQWRLGGNAHSWYSLDGHDLDGPFDMLFVDGPAGYLGSQARWPALPLLCERLADGAIIVVDDAGRAQEGRMLQRWLREYPQLSLAPGHEQDGFAVLHWRRGDAAARS